MCSTSAPHRDSTSLLRLAARDGRVVLQSAVLCVGLPPVSSSDWIMLALFFPTLLNASTACFRSSTSALTQQTPNLTPSSIHLTLVCLSTDCFHSHFILTAMVMSAGFGLLSECLRPKPSSEQRRECCLCNQRCHGNMRLAWRWGRESSPNTLSLPHDKWA